MISILRRDSIWKEVIHDSLVGELGERVEANRLRGGQLSLRDERLDLVGDRAPSCDFASQSPSLHS